MKDTTVSYIDILQWKAQITRAAEQAAILPDNAEILNLIKDTCFLVAYVEDSLKTYVDEEVYENALSMQRELEEIIKNATAEQNNDERNEEPVEVA